MTSPPLSPCPACAGHHPDDTDNPRLICRCGTHWQTPAQEHTVTIQAATADRDARILDLYKGDMPVKDIAAEFGLTSARISQIAVAAHIPLRRPQNAPKHVNAAKVITDHHAGLTVAEIATQHRVSESTIRRYLKHADLTANPPARRGHRQTVPAPA
ncbi:helix-turn-helix domain-containing protein [Nonomuraea fuscirosea]|uniref:helix-turn-helix domain-containing protein n=1 Tax=Nonomuraea fuscirosea TaxID=1291556 RepID=UPI00379A41FC